MTLTDSSLLLPSQCMQLTSATREVTRDLREALKDLTTPTA